MNYSAPYQQCVCVGGVRVNMCACVCLCARAGALAMGGKVRIINDYVYNI